MMTRELNLSDGCLVQKSLNGTYVNSTRIERHALRDGDIVQFGGAAKLKCGERLLNSSGSITYRFVAGTLASSSSSSTASSKKRKAAEHAKPDELEALTNKVNEQQKQIEELLEKLRQSTAESDRLQKELDAAMETSRQRHQEDGARDALHFDLGVLESSLRCAICRGVLVDPVVLPCSHGFCLACVAARARFVAWNASDVLPVRRLSNALPLVVSLQGAASEQQQAVPQLQTFVTTSAPHDSRIN